MHETTIIILTVVICTTILFCVALYTLMKKAIASEAEALTHFRQQPAIINDNITKTKEK